MASLLYQRADGTERVLEVGEEPLVIGRLDDCAIPIHDTFISRVHCGIAYHDHQFRLKDLSSSNGTYCSGTRIFECTLSPSDRIQLGNTTLVFEIAKGRAVLRQLTSATPGRPAHGITGAMSFPKKQPPP